MAMAMAGYDPDLLGAASDRHMASHLTAPFAAGAQETAITIDSGGTASVAPGARTRLLLAAPLAPLDSETLILRTTGGPPGQLTFAPYTEAGAWLPLVATSSLQSPVTLTLDRIGDHGRTTIPANLVATLIGLRLLEGVTAAVLYLLGAEKQRIRRQARELAAMRLLDRARGVALDRLGADVSVPRFTDMIAYDPASQEIITQPRSVPEPDQEYRRRIAIYRPMLAPTARRVDELLNGSADDTQPNTGPLNQIDPGFTQRVQIIEDYQPFAIAVHVVGTAADQAHANTMRTNLLDYVRRTYLVWPLNTREGNDAHSARLLPPSRKHEITGLRSRLRRSYTFTPATGQNPTLAPLLAAALDRLARCREAIHAAISGDGAPSPLTISAAQQDEGGSRYELGLGANLTALADLDALAGAQPHASSADPEIEALLSAMAPAPASQDPDGRWLLGPCGLQTVHRLDATTLYVSHLPSFGLVIDSPDGTPGNTAAAAGWALIVAGDFGGPTHRDLMVYDRLNALGQFYSVGTDGGLTKLGTAKTGWRQSWSIILAGRFGAGPYDDLLFYDPATGEAQFYSYNGATDALVLQGATQTGWRTTWSHIAVGNFGGVGQLNDLLFYDQQNGEIEFYSGYFGGLSRLGKTIEGVRRTWSHVTVGQFIEAPAWEHVASDVFFYDRDTGVGELHQVDVLSRLALTRPYADLASGWSHVVPGWFSGGALDDLLFYDSRAGACTLAHIGVDAELTRSATGRWEAGLTEFVSGTWSGTRRLDLLAYDRARDRAVVGQVALSKGSRGASPALTVYRMLQVDALTPATAPKLQRYTAHYNAPLTSSNVVLADGLRATAQAWSAEGKAPFTQLTKAAGTTAWSQAQANAVARGAFLAAGLPDPGDLTTLAARLGSVQPDLLDTIKLSPALAAQILAGGGIADLQTLVELFRDGAVGSVLPFVSGTDAFLVAAVVGLPGVGLNLAERPSAGFHWYTVGLSGLPATVSPDSAPTTDLAAADDGLTALVAVAYARKPDLADPYEYRVNLPSNAALNLVQYEFLMNLLDHAHPAGVGIDTWAVRRRHVKLNGAVSPLPPAIWSTFRSFRRPRGRGAELQPAPSGSPAGPTIWGSLGGEVAGGLVAVAAGDLHLEVFTVGGAGDLRRLAQAAANGAWGEWQSLGTPAGTVTLTGDLAAARNNDGRLEVLARASDGAVWHRSESSPGGAWSPWASLGGAAGGPIAVAANADGRLEAVMRGSAGDVLDSAQTAAGASTWSGWKSLGGSVEGALAIARNEDGRLDVFAQAADNSVSHATQATAGGSLPTWAPLGGNAQNALAVAANSDGRLELFAVAGGASDGELTHATQTTAGGGWTAWSPLGGSFGTVLAVGQNLDGSLSAVGGGPDNTMFALWQNDLTPATTWSPPAPLGDEVLDLIAIAANADGRLEVFARGIHHDLRHIAQVAPNRWSTS